MPSDLTGQSVPDFFEFMLEQYRAKPMGEAGEAATLSKLDQLFAQFETGAEQKAAADAINDFLAFAHQFLLEHPPHSHIMLSQGFGMELAGGFQVSLVPQATEEVATGAMQPAHAQPVTTGLGKSGTIASAVQPVTQGNM